MRSKGSFQVSDWLAFTVSHRLFVFTARGRETSTANDLLVGLALLADYRFQTF